MDLISAPHSEPLVALKWVWSIHIGEMCFFPYSERILLSESFPPSPNRLFIAWGRWFSMVCHGLCGDVKQTNWDLCHAESSVLIPL